MFGSLQLLGRRLDLDAPWVDEVTFEMSTPDDQRSGSDADPTWDSCLVWLTALLRFALDHGASAVRLRRDGQAKCLHQDLFVPTGDEKTSDQCLELVSMVLPRRDVGFRAVRMIASMMPWTGKGTIHYRYKGRPEEASCVQQSADDVVIQFTARSPGGLTPAGPVVGTGPPSAIA